ncbi:MAG TPA: isocitrate/isopropylmalate family dehydrogenase [Gaiellaceae bacterium]|jgi:3-isopropylmalate dehydrogenase
MRKKRYLVACLSGDGIGPEVMAEASRALARVSQLHGFGIDEQHLPFGGDAVRRFGHPLPAATRAACRTADAVLVATTTEPALDGVKAELDLTWRMTRVGVNGARLTVVSPLAEDALGLAVERAFSLACNKQARVTSVGAGADWRAAVELEAERCPGVVVEHVDFEAVVPALFRDPARFDVIVSEEVFADALSHTAAYAHGDTRMVASGRLSADQAGIFGPTHGSALDIAGQGVANPSGMLLAAALMLEGLGERSAARTLEKAVAETLGEGIRTPDLITSGAGATTREFMDVLLEALPGARTDAEFAGVAA